MKFFRKIRQNLLSDGKTGQYLKYAIGEIVLVVLGILIALQINNWNQNKQLEKEELDTLKSLHESIRINIDEFEQIRKAQIVRNNSLQEILFKKVSNQPLAYLDSLIITNVENHTFDPSTGIYNSIINSGKIELISNDSLKNRISKLYDSVKDYQEIEDEITAYTREHLEKNFIENYSIQPEVLAKLRERTDEEKEKDKASFIKVFNSQKVKNIYIMLLKKMDEVIIRGEYLESEYHSLLTALENEINN
ncbi:DUF6090 family protein [Flagellimonas sp. GZD32]|uniref:DUF6090 family protein n=1 Tax=Flagellimonas cixiensis TaxID=3228750 RepID=UPI0035C93DF7